MSTTQPTSPSFLDRFLGRGFDSPAGLRHYGVLFVCALGLSFLGGAIGTLPWILVALAVVAYALISTTIPDIDDDGVPLDNPVNPSISIYDAAKLGTVYISVLIITLIVSGNSSLTTGTGS